MAESLQEARVILNKQQITLLRLTRNWQLSNLLGVGRIKSAQITEFSVEVEIMIKIQFE